MTALYSKEAQAVSDRFNVLLVLLFLHKRLWCGNEFIAAE